MTPSHKRFGRAEWLAISLSLAVLLVFLWVSPDHLWGRLETVGYAVCHRIPERSFFFGGRQLPLCARCTGTFAAALLNIILALLRGRWRASRLPPPPVTFVLLSFVLLWGLDGFNSYLTLFPSLPHAYPPRNWLRLTSGALNGVTLSSLVMLIASVALWRQPQPDPLYKSLRELGGILLIVALFVGLVLSETPWLGLPIALLSALGVLTMLGLLNTVIVLILARRENQADHWLQALPWLLSGLAVSLLLVLGIVALRTALTGSLDLPWQ